MRHLTPLAIILLGLGMAGAPSHVAAQVSSMWQRRDPVMINPYADVKARRPGDLLVIRIIERSDVENRDQRLMQKQNSSSSDASLGAGVAGILGNSNGAMNFDQESGASRQFNGNTQFRSEREFIDQFTVMVIDTTPNGNLLVSGTRHVALEGDQRTLVLTGVVRAADILADNTIPSSRVFNLDIRYESADDKGAERRFVNQGWLGKQLNRLWPY